jgi:LAS superfamily LD-carboxypeptidase LdcB
MKINLKFWEYFGSKSASGDDTRLVPSRKSRVRLNIKGVQVFKEKKSIDSVFNESLNIDDNFVFDRKNFTEISKDNNSKDRTLANPDNENNQEIHSQKEKYKSIKNFSMPDFPFFSKNFQNPFSKYRSKLDEDFLKDEVTNARPWGMFFLIFSIIVLLLTTVYVFWSSFVNVDSISLDNCKSILADGVIKGLKTDDLDCMDKRLDQELDQRTSKIKEILLDREEEINQEIANIDKEIENLKDSLALFDVLIEEKIVSKKNLQSTLDFKKEEILDLQKKLDEKKSTIVEFENNFEYLLGVSPNLPLEGEKNFLIDYKNQTDGDKFKNFGLLKENFTVLQEKLKFQVSKINPYAAKGFTDPEFFKFKIFDASSFVDLFDKNNIASGSQEFLITGNSAGDKRILELGKKRGYKLRPVIQENKLVKIDSQLLDPKIKDDFEKLKVAASQDGIQINIASGFRSLNQQKDLFLGRLSAKILADSGSPLLPEDLAAGRYDSSIEKILSSSSIPGYSKHHTGLTIDINQNDSSDLTTFGQTEAYKWISANNYFNAKKHGFIPSYPEGSKNVGPDPEPWEYVWVGVDALRN